MDRCVDDQVEVEAARQRRQQRQRQQEQRRLTEETEAAQRQRALYALMTVLQQEQAEQPPQQPPQAEQQAMQRRMQQARRAFENADPSSPDSMRRALQHLLLIRCGGDVLKAVIQQWSTHTFERQQAAFDTALLALCSGDLGELEAQLQVVLQVVA